MPRRKLVKVAWKEGMDEIHPEYFPAKKEQKVPVTIQTRGVPDGTDGSAFEIELFGYREELKEGEDSRTPIRLPLTLLGIEAPADVKIKSDRLKSVKAGTRPALELRVPWTKVADLDGKDVYPVEMLTFKVQAKLKDGIPEEGRRSAELKRTIPVVIFANPDAVEKQERFWKSGEKIRDDAKGAKRLALLEAGRTPGKPSTFESGASRGVIPLKIPRTHMRGTSHAFYRGHGYLLTHDGKSPCQNCKFRDHWSQLSADDQKTYRANILQPTRWDGTKSKFVSMSWSALQKAVTDHDKIFIQFEMDESRGDANFTPTTTPGNLPWTTRLKSMFGALMSWDMDKLHEGLQFCMSKPSVALLRSAAATRLGGYSIPTDQNATNGPSFFSDGTATQGAPDIVGAAGPGQTVPKGTPIYINTIEAKCEQGEDVEGQRAGFIFWQSATGDTFAKKGGKPAMCFGHTGIAGWLLPDKVDSLDGEWPVPTDLMYASGCLTAATSELADSFLKKGTKVYIGNRIVAWGTWNRQMAEAFSKKVFTDKKTCEQAFNDLKGEYVGKLRCAMWKKTEGGTEYVDQ